MGARGKLALSMALLALVAFGVVGCGSGGESGTADESTKPERIYPNVTGPTREFLVPEGDNAIQFFGREAPPAEREAASKMIHAWMHARAKADWAKDCSYFHRTYSEELTKDAHGVSDGKVKTCPQALDYFGPQASGNRRFNMTGPIVSLRMREGRGYAQYHGDDGHDWIVPVMKEKGQWKVTIAAPIERNS